MPTIAFLDAAAPCGPESTPCGPVSIAEGRFVDGAADRTIDLTGYLLLPGIVDMHGDAFERHLAPRRGAVKELGPGLRAMEAELAANGITTACLAQFWSWEGGIRSAAFSRRLAEALDAHNGTDRAGGGGSAAQALLDLRLQLRFEISGHADFEEMLAFVARHGIGYVVMNDHLPHDALAKGRRPPRLEGQALKAGRSPAEHHALLQSLHDGMPEARRKLPGLVQGLRALGVLIGSHDDDTPQMRAGWREMGTEVAEFPMNRETAQAAREAGDTIVMGAPNVVRGGSHGKGVSARELIDAGLCDVLVSDYHYPALYQSAFALHDAGMPLGEAWALISERPARALGLDDRGRIEPGLRADLVIVEEGTRRIAGTICAGRFAYLSGELAHRVMEA